MSEPCWGANIMAEINIFASAPQAIGSCVITATLIAATLWYVFGWGCFSKNKRPSPLASLQAFTPAEVLKDEDDGRVVTLLGRFSWQKEDEMALVKLIATPLSLQGLRQNLGRLMLRLKSESGAEYSFYDCSVSPWTSFLHGLKANSYSLEVVAPASERTINRNRPVVTRMVTETAGMYASITAPHIDKVVGDGSSLSWLFNVLSKEKEAERVLFEDQDPEHGFLMNIDTKWRTHPDINAVPLEEWRLHPCVTDLYCLSICHQRGIRTLRDLRLNHVPMLKEIHRRGVQTIEAVYGVPEDQLRVFVHYMPQFFHFHVHFTRIHNTIGVEAERAHLLVNIIQNLELDSEFYAKRTMQFRVRENDALHKAFKTSQGLH